MLVQKLRKARRLTCNALLSCLVASKSSYAVYWLISQNKDVLNLDLAAQDDPHPIYQRLSNNGPLFTPHSHLVKCVSISDLGVVTLKDNGLFHPTETVHRML